MSNYLGPISNARLPSPSATQQPLILGARARNFKWAPGSDPFAFIPAPANLQVSLPSLRPESERTANTDTGDREAK